MADNDNDETSKEPFVSDRPPRGPAEVRHSVGELTVRDLATLLGQLGPSGKDFWDGKDWVKDDFDGPVIKWKDKEKEKEKERAREVGEKREA